MPSDLVMNNFAADPEWGWWIVWYFFLGGIAAGAYFLATLAELFGSPRDRQALRAGYFLAPPLVAICGLLLILDLTKPLRFWHMLLDHDTWLPHIKLGSPMSVGAWAVLLFGGLSGISFATALSQSGLVGGRRGESRFPSGSGQAAGSRQRLHPSLLSRAFALLATACGFFVASYTGVLLSATSQPIWNDSPWIGVLFLASASGTGLAAIRLSSPWLPAGPLPRDSDAHRIGTGLQTDHVRLDQLDIASWCLEVAAMVLLLYSLGWQTVRNLAVPSLLLSFLAGALGLGIVVPALFRWQPCLLGRWTAAMAAVAVLLGGFALRYAVLQAPLVVSK